jgi:PAS domain S-box-containing protein
VTRLWRRWRLSVVLPLAVASGLSVALFVYASHREDESVRRAFEERARTLASAVRVSCEGHLEVLLSLNDLFASAPNVDEQEFHRFVNRALSRNPGIRGLSWNPRVEAADRARFEAESGAAITELDSQGRRVPATGRAEYVVVRFIEPASNKKPMGLDVGSEPVRREALERARDTGKVVATGPIQLVNEEGGQLNVLVFAPVYSAGDVPVTVEQRRREIRGYTTGAFRLGDLVEAALRKLPRDGIAVALVDVGDSVHRRLLYTDAGWPRREDGRHQVRRQRFLFAERPWEIHVVSTQPAGFGSWRAWMILFGGLLFTGLLGAFLHIVTSRAARVQEVVNFRTAQLHDELQERQKAEGVVRIGEARNRAILRHMLGGMITFDDRGRIESVNPAAERMFGYREDELIGGSVALLLADAPNASAQEAWLHEVHKQSIGRITEWPVRRKAGETFPAESALFEFATPEGRRFAWNFQDISERREVDRLKSEFVSTVSHELRTPLTSIRGALGLLAAGVLGDLPLQVRDLLRLAERNAVRLTALINDILDFERLDSGRFELKVAEVDLDLLFEQALEAVRPVALEQEISLVCQPAGIRLLADADRVVQVLINLLSNALKFSPPGSEIHIWVKPGEAGMARLQVKDQGPGIPEGYHQRVFERFGQVETAAYRDKGGTGLGLAICKAIVEHHGGRIGVQSEPGKGSTFWAELPMAA